MPLTLITGRAGCGKTAYLAEQIAARIDREKKRITLIVPDQYTVASENFFLDRLGEKRFRYLNVTSLKSLARTEFSAHGVRTRFLEEGGKLVLLRKAADAVSPQFRYYPPDYRNPRFLSLLSGAIKELKAAGISAEDLLKTAERNGNKKLYDLAQIRQVYEGYLSDDRFDPDDAPARLCRVLEETGDFEDEAVYVTNFRSFYRKERNVLLQLVKNGADVTVTLPTDTSDPERSEATADAAAELRTLLAFRDGDEKPKTVALQPQATFPWEEFAFLERQLIEDTGESFPGAPEHIRLFRGEDRFDEAEQAASVIAEKVREQGYRYSDFTVIVRSLEDYAGILDPVFDQYGIPLFYHRRTPLRRRNPMPMITALFALTTDGYDPDDVLNFVKSGFFETPERVAAFERYVSVWNIRYDRFRTPFTRPITGFSGAESPEDTKQRNAAEQVRQKIVRLTEDFRKTCRHATVRQICEGLLRVLEELNMAETLDRHAREYEAFGEAELAARQRKVYEQLMRMLDELVLTAGDDEMSVKEYRDLFLAVADTHDIAILPTSLDEVTAGSPETLPMISPRCVFVLGLNEGVFPRNVDDDRLLTDEDREQLKDPGIGETTGDKIRHEMYYLYAALTAPREELYLSYSSRKGELPGSAVRRLRKCWFPELKTEEFRKNDPDSVASRIQRENAAFSLYSKTPVTELGEWFAQSPVYAPILEARRQTEQLTPEISQRIYPDKLCVSATQTDLYHKCRYAYFLKYGMGITPEEKAELNAAQIGTLLHAVLEHGIAGGLDCPDEELNERVTAFGAGKLKEMFGEEEIPANFRNYFDRLMEKAFRLLLLFRAEFSASLFRPVAFEQKIGTQEGAVPPIEIPLERGNIVLIGTADRVDSYEKDGVRYLRIVDYKSSEKIFSFQKVRNGLNIQMLMYLFSVQHNMYPGQNCLPAGVQYVTVNPKLTAENDLSALGNRTFEDAVNTRRSGVYLKDNGILSAMDETAERVYLGKIRPDSENLITAEKFGDLFEEISEILKKMGDSVHDGIISRNPVKIGSSEDSCRFCPLKPYCRAPEPREILLKKDPNTPENAEKANEKPQNRSKKKEAE